MKRHIWSASLVIACMLMVTCIIALIAALNMQPGSPDVLALALTGMFHGVLASVFGAISFSTYMPRWERAQLKEAALTRKSGHEHQG